MNCFVYCDTKEDLLLRYFSFHHNSRLQMVRVQTSSGWNWPRKLCRGVEWCVPKPVLLWATGTPAPRPHRALRLSRMNLEDMSQGPGQRALEGGMGPGDGWEGRRCCSNAGAELNSAQHLQTLRFSPDLTCRPHGQPRRPLPRSALLQTQHGDACAARPTATQRYRRCGSWQGQHSNSVSATLHWALNKWPCGSLHKTALYSTDLPIWAFSYFISHRSLVIVSLHSVLFQWNHILLKGLWRINVAVAEQTSQICGCTKLLEESCSSFSFTLNELNSALLYS